jgi:hypothetical protein
MGRGSTRVEGFVGDCALLFPAGRGAVHVVSIGLILHGGAAAGDDETQSEQANPVTRPT